MNAKGQTTKGYKHHKIDTHCKNGHEFTEENTYTPPGTTKRSCITCRSENSKKCNVVNKDQIKKTRQARRKLRPDCTPEQRRERNLKHHGWTTDKFNEKVVEQKGRCAICKKVLTFEDKISGSRACADHLHTNPPKPRGVLCTNCNLGIGNLQENYKIMEAAIAYVKKYQEG